MKISQLCLTLCDPMVYSLPGSSVHGILQARILEWVAVPLLQGIFPTQGSNPGLPYFRWIFYQLSHKETLTLTNGPSGKYKFPFIDGKSHLYFNKDIIVLFIHVNLN